MREPGWLLVLVLFGLWMCVILGWGISKFIPGL